jgi:putative NADH-flavin reductase
MLKANSFFRYFAHFNIHISMNILILGATGRTGKLVAQMAAGSNHHVTAIVRNKSRFTMKNVTCIEGSPTDANLLGKVLKGMDAVVVSLNVNRTSDNPFAKVVSPLTLISDSVRALITAMEQNGVRRIITVSASGVGDSWMDMPLIARLLIRNSNIMRAYEDHDRQEKLLPGSTLDWTVVRPVMLNNKDNETYRVPGGKPNGGGISRKAVAKFILDALESGKYTREFVTING